MRSLRWPLLGALPFLLLLAAPATAQDGVTEQYARVQQGQWKESIRWLQQQTRLLPADASLEQRRRKKEIELDWQFTVGLFDQVPWGERTAEMTSHPLTLLAWAVDAWNHGFTVEVRKEAEALAALRKANPQSLELQLIEPQARALFLQGSGLPDSAVAVLRAAARLEASQPAQALPRPAHEALGEMLYWLGRNAEAQDAFQQSLARTPGRARSITGLALSARAGGDTAVADRAMAQLRANFQAADEGAVESMLKSVRKVK